MREFHGHTLQERNLETEEIPLGGIDVFLRKSEVKYKEGTAGGSKADLESSLLKGRWLGRKNM